MRMPPSRNRFNRRSESDRALAARMLARLKEGADVRSENIDAARKQLDLGALDNAVKLDRAMDVLIGDLESEIEAVEITEAELRALHPEMPRFVQVKCITPLRRRGPNVMAMKSLNDMNM